MCIYTNKYKNIIRDIEKNIYKKSYIYKIEVKFS